MTSSQTLAKPPRRPRPRKINLWLAKRLAALFPLRPMLSERVFSDTPGRFFALLSSRHARRFIDVLDVLEELQRRRHGGGLTRQEVMDAAERVLGEAAGQTGQAGLSADTAEADGDDDAPATLTAAEMLRQLVHAGWLEEPRRNDYQRVYFVDGRAELLLESLRRMAFPEKVTFTDKLHLACTRLQDPNAFQDHPLSDLEACLENLRYGIQELRGLQQGVARLTQRQMKSDSLRENLRVLYDDFSDHIGQRCYKQLIALNLPLRLPLVRENLHAIEANPIVRARMEAQLAERRPDLSPEEVENQIRDQLRDAIDLLDSVEPQADAVDQRAADFARRSFARFRYLQEVSSGRRAEMRALFEAVNEACQGAGPGERPGELPESLDLPALRLPCAALLAGLDSLSIPQGTRRAGTRRPIEADLEFDEFYDAAIDEMADNINSSLTVLRANRFAAQLGIGSEGISSDQLDPDHEEWLLELAGLLLHAETLDASYLVHSPRENGEEPARDLLAGHFIDRFQLTQKP